MAILKFFRKLAFLKAKHGNFKKFFEAKNAIFVIFEYKCYIFEGQT